MQGKSQQRLRNGALVQGESQQMLTDAGLGASSARYFPVIAYMRARGMYRIHADNLF